LADLAALIASLRAAALFDRDEPSGEREAAAPGFLEAKLEALGRSCAVGDSLEAEALVRELRTKIYVGETAALVETICAQVESMDYDLVIDAVRAARGA
jgi:hypothetical protein